LKKSLAHADFAVLIRSVPTQDSWRIQAMAVRREGTGPQREERPARELDRSTRLQSERRWGQQEGGIGWGALRFISS